MVNQSEMKNHGIIHKDWTTSWQVVHFGKIIQVNISTDSKNELKNDVEWFKGEQQTTKIHKMRKQHFIPVINSQERK
jgi:hypothetical protein